MCVCVCVFGAFQNFNGNLFGMHKKSFAVFFFAFEMTRLGFGENCAIFPWLILVWSFQCAFTFLDTIQFFTVRQSLRSVDRRASVSLPLFTPIDPSAIFFISFFLLLLYCVCEFIHFLCTVGVRLIRILNADVLRHTRNTRTEVKIGKLYQLNCEQKKRGAKEKRRTVFLHSNIFFCLLPCCCWFVQLRLWKGRRKKAQTNKISVAKERRMFRLQSTMGLTGCPRWTELGSWQKGFLLAIFAVKSTGNPGIRFAFLPLSSQTAHYFRSPSSLTQSKYKKILR